jgi:hypothetical protein
MLFQPVVARGDEARPYTYFVDPTNPNKPGSEWQFDANIVVEHPTEGTLVLDVLKDQRIGGFETLDRIEE